MTERINVGPGGSLDLDNLFTYHPPKADQIGRYQQIRAAGRALAERVAEDCPPSPERSLALQRIREAVMWANASIACNEEPATPEPTLEIGGVTMTQAQYDAARYPLLHPEAADTEPEEPEEPAEEEGDPEEPVGNATGPHLHIEAPAGQDVAPEPPTVADPDYTHLAQSDGTPSCGLPADAETPLTYERRLVTCRACRAVMEGVALCTTCGHPAVPHPFRHPVTTANRVNSPYR